MDTKDIMVGDFVRYTEDQWETDDDKVPRTITGIGEPEYPDNMPFVKIDGSNERYHISLFEPIPLSEEILAKNFKLSGYDRYYVGKDLYVKWYDNDTFGFGKMNDAYNEPQFESFAKSNSVHELQHALRLVGLNKVADNLKV